MLETVNLDGSSEVLFHLKILNLELCVEEELRAN